jgi:hypothetical protein
MTKYWRAVAMVFALAWALFIPSAPPPPSSGFLLDLATSPESCGDGRETVAAAVGGHRFHLNPSPLLDRRELSSRLREILKYRAAKLVYVRAEPGTSHGDFTELLDTVRPEAEIISLITPQVEVLAQTRYCLAPSCGVCDDARSARLKARPH